MGPFPFLSNNDPRPGMLEGAALTIATAWQHKRKAPDVVAPMPAQSLPEVQPFGITGKNIDVEFLDTLRGDCGDGTGDEAAANAPAPQSGQNGQVIKITAPAIVAAENAARDAPAGLRDEAHARIAGEIARDPFQSVRVPKDHPLRLRQKIHNPVVVFYR